MLYLLFLPSLPCGDNRSSGIVGHDDVGIVTNITSIINKENDILLRSISIDSHDGLFSGMMTVMVDDTSKLESLVKKIKTVKGVKQVNRG